MVRVILLVLLVPIASFAVELKLIQGYIKAHTEVFGDSTIDPYTEKIQANLHMDSSIESLKGEIKINSFDLISDNKKRDQHMYETLESKVYPTILFKLLKVEKRKNQYQLEGFLNLHGISTAISVPCNISLKDSLMDLKCNFTIKMTDYNMEPPTFLFLTVRDKVDIDVDLKLKRSSK